MIIYYFVWIVTRFVPLENYSTGTVGTSDFFVTGEKEESVDGELSQSSATGAVVRMAFANGEVEQQKPDVLIVESVDTPKPPKRLASHRPKQPRKPFPWHLSSLPPFRSVGVEPVFPSSVGWKHPNKQTVTIRLDWKERFSMK